MLFKGIKNVHDCVKPIQDNDIQSTERLNQKLKFLQITQKDLSNLRKLEDILNEYAAPITERHYEMIIKFTDLNQMILDHSTVDRLSKTFVEYIKSIAKVEINIEYIRSRRKIGQAHSRIKLSPEWFAGSFIRLYEYLIPAIVQKFSRNPKEMADILLSLNRILSLDTQIALASYQEAHDFGIVENASNIMEIIIGTNRVNTLFETVETVESAMKEVELVSQATNEMSSTVESITKTASAVSAKSIGMLKEVNEGQSVVEKSLVGFQGIGAEFKQTKGYINDLIEEVENISVVIGFIRDIAEQTNLLALNASIEAARAGEHGKGFSVVASEVRKLAEQTTNSVNTITEKIQNMETEADRVEKLTDELIEQINHQVAESNNAIEVLKRIINKIDDVGSSTENIASITSEQATATHHITESMANVLEDTRKISQKSLGTGASIFEISLQFNELRNNAIGSIYFLRNKEFIRIIQTEVLLWKWWLYNAILGYHKLEGTSYLHESKKRIVTWYENMNNNKQFQSLPSFKEMKPPYKMTSKLIEEILKDISNDDKELAKEKLTDLEYWTNLLIQSLQQIASDIKNTELELIGLKLEKK